MLLILIFVIPSIFLVIPFLFFAFIKYIFYNLYFKLDKITYRGLIKKSWLFSFLWLILIFISLIVLEAITDNLFIRIIVSFGFISIILLINYLNLKKIEPINSINKKAFVNFYAVNFSISIIVIVAFFCLYFPNEIIKLNTISDFNKKLNHIYTSNSELKKINEDIQKSKNVLFAKYNKTEEKITIIIKLENDYEKKLFSKIGLNKITKQYLDTNYISLNDEELKNPTKKIGMDNFKTNRIGQSIIYTFRTKNPSFLVDFKTSYHYNEIVSLNNNEFSDHYCNVDVFYDSKSKCLVLVEEINSDGP
jgi:hypothetical protein